MATVEFLEKDQICQDEQTRYWFNVDGENYCIADTNGETSLLDSEGYPVEECNDSDGIKGTLIPEYEKHISD